MNEELKSTKAGEYTLVARPIDGRYQGALWAQGRIIERIQGHDLDVVYEKLQALLADHLAERIAARGEREPSVEEGVKALSRVFPNMTAGQRSMLRAHFKSPDRKITATQLAQAAGFSSYSGANLQYGLLGAMLLAEIPEELRRRPNGTRVTTFAIATGEYPDDSPDSPDWVWEMRPHIAEALKRIASF